MKKILISMLAMVAMVSCSSESDPIDEVNPDTKSSIVFGSSIATVETKTIKTGDSFTQGEAIAVIGYKGASVPTDYSSPFMDNASFTWDATNKFTSADSKAFWGLGDTHYFYAYYPVATTTETNGYQYLVGTSSMEPYVKIICQDTTGIEPDLLWARPTNNGIKYTSATTGSIMLPFTHKLARIAFNIKRQDNNVPECSLAKIEFKTSTKSKIFKLVNGIFSEAPADIVNEEILLSKEITATSITTGGISADNFSPMLFPGTSIKDLKIYLDNNESFNVNISNIPKFVEGKITTINITITSKGLIFDTNLSDWTDGDSKDNGTGTI